MVLQILLCLSVSDGTGKRIKQGTLLPLVCLLAYFLIASLTLRPSQNPQLLHFDIPIYAAIPSINMRAQAFFVFLVIAGTAISSALARNVVHANQHYCYYKCVDDDDKQIGPLVRCPKGNNGKGDDDCADSSAFVCLNYQHGM